MAQILIADTTDGAGDLSLLLEDIHELVVVQTVERAEAEIGSQAFDLVIVGVHFDQSRAFELIAKINNCAKNAATPIICVCTRDTQMTRLTHQSLGVTIRALGAWMYLDQHTHGVDRDPAAELQRIIERCLAGGERGRINAQRLDIQRRRAEILRLRSELHSEKWSLALEDRLGVLRGNLACVLQELSQTYVRDIKQQECIARSRGLNDRVSNDVQLGEEQFSHEDRSLRLSEAEQFSKEQAVVAQEERKGKKGRFDLAREHKQHRHHRVR
jgi:response regulator RpfG family c-di-GMP phosphodiesterase